MSEIKAPEVEPIAPKKAPRPRGKYIDFAPRRKKPAQKPAAEVPNRKVTVIVARQPEPEPEPTLVEEPEEIFEEEELTAAESPIDEEEILNAAFPETEESSLDDEYSLLADFGSYEDEDDEELASEAQEDFISDDTDTSEYVGEVLSQVSETKVETTIRRSPFLKDYHVDKRPLSDHAPIRKKITFSEELKSTPHEEFKEEKFARRVDPTPNKTETPVVTKAEKTGSKLGAIITIAATVLLGAGVGVFIYLAFFQ